MMEITNFLMSAILLALIFHVNCRGYWQRPFAVYTVKFGVKHVGDYYDSDKKTDPWLQIRYRPGGHSHLFKTFKTKSMDGKHNGVFAETYNIKIEENPGVLELDLKDEDTISSDYIGRATIEMKEFEAKARNLYKPNNPYIALDVHDYNDKNKKIKSKIGGKGDVTQILIYPFWNETIHSGAPDWLKYADKYWTESLNANDYGG